MTLRLSGNHFRGRVFFKSAVVANFYLDQFMIVQFRIDGREDAISQFLLANLHEGIERVGEAFEVLFLFRGKGVRCC